MDQSAIARSTRSLHLSRATWGYLGFGAILIALSYKALVQADLGWDNLAYHLPFAAIRVKLIDPLTYGMNAALLNFYRGFPPAIYYAKGILWIVTGNPNAINLVSVAAVGMFCLLFARIAKVPPLLTFIAVAAVPVIQVNLASGYLDIVPNLAISLALVCIALMLLAWPVSQSTLFLVTLAATCVAANSKPQFIAISSALAVLVVCIFVLRSALLPEPQKRLGLPLTILATILFACVHYVGIRNTILFGSPFFPAQISGDTFASLEPQYLKDSPPSVRWLLSVLEFRAFDLRPIPYVADQGDVPLDAYSNRMGGYFSAYVVFNILTFIYLVITNKSRRLIVVGLLFIVLTVGTSMLPLAHDLRYYSFWILSLIGINLALIFGPRNRGPDLRFAFWAVSISAFVFVSAITGFVYLTPYSRTFDDLVVQLHIRERFVSKMVPGRSYCLINWGRFWILAAPVWHPTMLPNVRIRDALNMNDCQRNDVVLDFNAGT